MKVFGVYASLKREDNPRLSYRNQHYFFKNRKSAIEWAEKVFADNQVISLEVIGERGEILFSDKKIKG